MIQVNRIYLIFNRLVTKKFLVDTSDIDSKIGDSFKTFLSTNTGFGTIELQKGKPVISVVFGKVDVRSCVVSGNQTSFEYQN